jgi:hypothetical protein
MNKKFEEVLTYSTGKEVSCEELWKKLRTWKERYPGVRGIKSYIRGSSVLSSEKIQIGKNWIKTTNKFSPLFCILEDNHKESGLSIIIDITGI